MQYSTRDTLTVLHKPLKTGAGETYLARATEHFCESVMARTAVHVIHILTYHFTKQWAPQTGELEYIEESHWLSHLW
jgi:hypothetical protein